MGGGFGFGGGTGVLSRFGVHGGPGVDGVLGVSGRLWEGIVGGGVGGGGRPVRE